MSFRLGDIIVKEILWGVSYDLSTKAPLYVLSQLQEATIDITAESTDVTDKNGNIVKRIYKSKSGEFSATNAFLNANILQAASGTDAVFASDTTSVIIPMVEDFKAATTGATSIDLGLDETTTDSTSVKINALYGDGTLGAPITTATIGTDGKISIPEGANGDAPSYFISYNKTFKKDAAEITNKVDEFPNTVRMLFKVAYYDPCDKSDVKACYVEIPNFMVSPETSIALSSDSATQDISATMELDYCSADKVLYNIYFYDEEE